MTIDPIYVQATHLHFVGRCDFDNSHHVPVTPDAIGESVRIGITKDAEQVLRFYVRGSAFVSGTRGVNGAAGSR